MPLNETYLRVSGTTELGASRFGGKEPRPLWVTRNSNPRLVMNRFITVALLPVFASLPCARAQEIETAQIKLNRGYDYVAYNANPRINGVPSSVSYGANGITGQAAYNTNNRFGLGQESIGESSQPQSVVQPEQHRHIPLFGHADEFALSGDVEYYAPLDGFNRQNRDIDLQVASFDLAAH